MNMPPKEPSPLSRAIIDMASISVSFCSNYSMLAEELYAHTQGVTGSVNGSCGEGGGVGEVAGGEVALEHPTDGVGTGSSSSSEREGGAARSLSTLISRSSNIKGEGAGRAVSSGAGHLIVDEVEANGGGVGEVGGGHHGALGGAIDLTNLAA